MAPARGSQGAAAPDRATGRAAGSDARGSGPARRPARRDPRPAAGPRARPPGDASSTGTTGTGSGARRGAPGRSPLPPLAWRGAHNLEARTRPTTRLLSRGDRSARMDAVTLATALDVQPLSPIIGAEIGGLDLA